MNTDPIADFLTRVRNASRAGHREVRVPASNVKVAIAEIMKKHGYISGFRTVKEGKYEEILMMLKDEMSHMNLTRKSRPGQRKYVSATELRPVRNGYGIGIISTSHGIMTTDEAKEKGVGGEYICEIY